MCGSVCVRFGCVLIWLVKVTVQTRVTEAERTLCSRLHLLVWGGRSVCVCVCMMGFIISSRGKRLQYFRARVDGVCVCV